MKTRFFRLVLTTSVVTLVLVVKVEKKIGAGDVVEPCRAYWI